WPGNVRELKNILVRAVFNSDSNGDILPEHVDLNLADTGDREMPTFREVQENYFREVLRKARGRAAKAAAIAGVNRKTIYNKIEEFRLQDFVNSLRKKSP
ncbi:MAG: hypothetical protein HYT68_01880, partial [Candidatus Zambryskibacteria bacterium]|nr:hypothetical protein [Candidatus Zambryskibacteria bacterium]